MYRTLSYMLWGGEGFWGADKVAGRERPSLSLRKLTGNMDYVSCRRSE